MADNPHWGKHMSVLRPPRPREHTVREKLKHAQATVLSRHAKDEVSLSTPPWKKEKADG